MSKQKHFEAPYEIEAEIIKYRRKAKDKLIDAEAIEQKVKDMLAEANMNKKLTAGERCHLTDQAYYERKKSQPAAPVGGDHQ